MKPVKFQFEIAIRCDFADLFEVKSGNIVRRGRITTDCSEAHQQFRTVYRNRDFSRSVIISAHNFPKEPVYANGRLSFEVALDPGEAWHTCLLYALTDNESIRRRHITALNTIRTPATPKPWRIGCGRGQVQRTQSE